MWLKAFRLDAQKPLVRRIAAVLLLGTAIIVEYYILMFPIPREIEEDSSTVTARQVEELVIKGPEVNPPTNDGLLRFLTYEGERLQVNAHFDRARLAPQTLETLRLLQLAPPSDPEEIEYKVTEASEEEKRKNFKEYIEMKFHINPALASAELHLFHPGEYSDDHTFPFGMQATGIELDVQMSTALPGSEQPGPRKILQVGEWKPPHPLPGTIPIQVTVEKQSPFYFRFISLDSSASLTVSFELGASSKLLVREVYVQARREDGTVGSSPPVKRVYAAPRISLISPNKRIFLILRDLKVDRNDIKVSLSGKGVAETGGQPEKGYQLSTRLGESWLLTAVLVALNGALITWFSRVFFAKRQKEPDFV